MKKLLFSTTLTAVIAATSLVAAADTTKATTEKKHTASAKHHAKKHTAKKHAKKTHDDAYHPSQHVKTSHASSVEKPSEDIVMFSDKKETKLIGMPNPFSKPDAVVNADGIAVKVGGKVDVQYGVLSQRKHFDNPSNGEYLPQSERNGAHTMPVFGSDNLQGKQFSNKQGIAANGKLEFMISKEDASGIKYGAEVEANANASPAASGNKNFANKTFLFVENEMGRVELGGNDGASEAMAVSAINIAKATDGIDGDYGLWIPYGAVSDDNNRSVLNHMFLTKATLPYASQYAKKSNKITYYTPKVNGFSGGLSYVPDTTVNGTVYELVGFKGNGYKDVVELGAGYEYQANDMKFAFSATGQAGSARDAYITKEAATGTSITEKSTLKLEDLRAWHVGTKVEYKGMAAAASYGDWGKSGTLKTPLTAGITNPKKEAKFWTAGLAYTMNEKTGISLTYLGSERQGGFAMDTLRYVAANEEAYNSAKNKYNAYSLGIEHKIMPGLTPYIEATTFEYKTPLANVKTNKGTVVLGGVKVSF